MKAFHSLTLLLVSVISAACSPPGSDSPSAVPACGQAAAPGASVGRASGTDAAASSRSPGTLPAGITELPLRSVESRRRGAPVAGFTDVTVEAGILHRHARGVFDAKLSNIMPWISSIGAAAAASDYDLDGDVDLYLTTSRQGRANALYRNEGGLRFVDAAREAGVADVNDDSGVSMDAAFADLDNDGDDDLYVLAWGRDRLFRNEGNGKFTDITAESGTGDPGNGNCVLPFDHDQDGLLDLFICNYFPRVDLLRLETTRIMHESFEAARNGGPNVLYRNLGGLRFEDVAPRLGLDDTGWSLDAGISDIDNDGDLDLYVANDFGQDRLYLASGDGTFTDVTGRAIGKETFKGMNIDFGDFNEDGFTDGYVANITTAEYLREGNMLLLNAGDGTFSNVAGATGTFDGGWGWCARFFDFDQDGHLDIFAVNGFVTAGPESYWEALANIAVDPAFDPQDSLEWPSMESRSLSGNEPDRLYRNRGDGSFEEVAAKYSIAGRRDGRGIALADFDNDGDLDAYVANQDARGALHQNDVGNTNRFVAITLEGTRSNRNGVGARIQVTAAGGPGGGTRKLTREQNGVNGFASQSSSRVLVGLGQADRIARLSVFWPSGVVQDFEDLPLDRHYRVVEAGEPVPAAELARLYFAGSRKGIAAASPAPAGGGAAPVLLLDLEEQLRRRPRNVPLANRYRSLCVESAQFDRSIDFFRSLVRLHPMHAPLRLQLALAFVDKIPSLDGDILAQGSLAKESLNELRSMEDLEPDSYALHYVSGMNHLYWPETFKHFDDAVRRFERCIEIDRARTAAGCALAPHQAEVHRALGDAHVKGKRLGLARSAWRAGLSLFPAHPDLEARLARSDEELTALVKEERGLKRRIDSRLPWLEGENGLARAEEALRGAPEDRALLNTYRLEAFEVGEVKRAIAFLEDVLRARPGSKEPRLHLALALADQISTLGAANEEVLRLADRVLAELRTYSASGGDWLGPYFMGICHLFRPPGEAAQKAAIDALGEALSLAAGGDGSPRVPYPGIALGDALASAGRAEEAVLLWRRTLEAFPRRRALETRLEHPAASLTQLVRAEYDLARGIPTDLELLADREGDLSALERKLGETPRAADGARYRDLVRRGDDPERAIRFLAGLLPARPRSAVLRVELALAYMDRIPSRDLGSVQKGLLSSEALTLLEETAAVHAQSWGLHFAIGLVHLNWFTKQKHVPHAIRSFERCLALQNAQERPEPRFALVYQGLGDALVKEGDYPRGRRSWKEGVERFPEDRGLSDRMGLTSLMVNRYVEDLRSWNSVVDTARLSGWIGELADLPLEGAQ